MNDRPDSILQLLQTRQRSNGAADAEVSTISADEAEYTAFARGRLGIRPQMMIAFCKCTGELAAFPYSLLTRIQATDPSCDLAMVFGNAKVCIQGRNLNLLLEYLCQHRVAEIREADRAAQLDSAEIVAPVVTRLSIEG